MANRLLTDMIQANVIESMVQDKLWATTIAKDIVQYTTQGELGYGSSYQIPIVTDFTVYDFDGTPITPQNTSATSLNIAIDRTKVLNYTIRDSDIKEATALNLAMVYSDQAGQQLAQTVDKDILVTIFNGATTNSTLGAPTSGVALSSSDAIITYVEKVANVLGEANIETDRVIVVPDFMYNGICRALGVSVNNQNIADSIRTGVLQNVFGCDILKSNNAPKAGTSSLATGEYAVLAGKRSCFQFVEGTKIVDSGKDMTLPNTTYNHLGLVYGMGFSQPAGWVRGVVKQA